MLRSILARMLMIAAFIVATSFYAYGQNPELAVGKPIDRLIKTKETQSFDIELKAGTTAVIEVIQKGADLQAEAFENDGKSSLQSFDIPNDFSDTDGHLLIAKKDGRYRFDISISTSGDDQAGYTITLKKIRPTTPEDIAINEAATRIFDLYSEGLKLKKETNSASRKSAFSKFEAIIPLSRIKQDKYWESLAYEYMASVSRSLSETQKALSYYAESLKLAESLNFKRKQAFLINQIGLTYYALSDVKHSTESFEKALALSREAKAREVEAGALNNLGLVADWVGDSAKAIDYYGKAREKYREMNNRYTEATVLGNIGLAYSTNSQPAKAKEYFDQALAYYIETKDQEGIGWIYSNLGTAYHNGGDVRTALGYYEKALAIRIAVEDKKGIAFTTGTIAGAYDRLGEVDKALELYERSIAMDREIKSGAEGPSLSNMALLYHTLGDDERALKLYEESLKLRREQADRRRESTVLGNIGSLFEAKGDLEKASTYYRDSLKISEDLKDKAGRALSYGRLASIARKKGDLKTAADLLQQALVLNREVENHREEASNLASIGLVADQSGDKVAALDSFTSSARIWHGLEDKNQEAILSYRKARVLRNLKRIPEAKQNIETAISLVEKFRGTIPDQRLRASYFATAQQYYQLYIEILLSENAPNAVSAAFELSERSRARSLLELLRQAKVDIRASIDPTLIAEERRLTELITGRSRQLTAMLNGKDAEEKAKPLKQEILEAESELNAVQLKMRGQNPRFAGLIDADAFSAAKVQRLLGADTVLLEYKLGDDQSYLWVVTDKEITVHELGPSVAIDSGTKKLYEAIISNDTNNDALITAIRSGLASKLLGPAAAKAKGKTLAIVADGVLQFMPFAFLADEIGPKELVSLPSASVLSELRSASDHRKPTAKTMAVFADAVFAETDVRLKAAKVTFVKTPVVTQRLLRDMEITSGLPRLLSSRVEARNISAFVPKEKVDLNVDFDASRENVIDRDLTPYNIIHFATHGLLDTTNPEFSGLVLSLYDKDGKQKDGIMRLGQIYNLKLNSDLVVLSACQTALGKDVRGEGMIGLTRGFMFAGAKRVVSTLWKVDDSATAEFMKLFYRNMLQNKMQPAIALRSAQNELRKIPRFRSPYYWAGFIIQGEL